MLNLDLGDTFTIITNPYVTILYFTEFLSLPFAVDSFLENKKLGTYINVITNTSI